MATIVIPGYTISDANLPQGITLADVDRWFRRKRPLLDENGDVISSPTPQQSIAHIHSFGRQAFLNTVLQGRKAESEAMATNIHASEVFG